MWLLQRAVPVEAWQGGLQLFAGMPSHWLLPAARIAVPEFSPWHEMMSAELVVYEQARAASITSSGVTKGTLVRV